MKRTAAMLLFFLASGCNSAPVADFLDWVRPSPVRPQGTAQPQPPASPPVTPALNLIIQSPEATPPVPPPSGPPAVPPPAGTNTSFRPPTLSSRPSMPPLPAE